jgi:hypothetical protein
MPTPTPAHEAAAQTEIHIGVVGESNAPDCSQSR